jgi:hypothetical protein
MAVKLLKTVKVNSGLPVHRKLVSLSLFEYTVIVEEEDRVVSSSYSFSAQGQVVEFECFFVLHFFSYMTLGIGGGKYLIFVDCLESHLHFWMIYISDEIQLKTTAYFVSQKACMLFPFFPPLLFLLLLFLSFPLAASSSASARWLTAACWPARLPGQPASQPPLSLSFSLSLPLSLVIRRNRWILTTRCPAWASFPTAKTGDWPMAREKTNSVAAAVAAEERAGMAEGRKEGRKREVKGEMYRGKSQLPHKKRGSSMKAET